MDFEEAIRVIKLIESISMGDRPEPKRRRKFGDIPEREREEDEAGRGIEEKCRP